MTSVLVDIVKGGGLWWPRLAHGPGRALAIPNGAQFRVALGEPGNPPFAGGACRDGRLALDGAASSSGERTFETAPSLMAAVRKTPGDPFACIEFRVRERWLSADALRRSGALPWDETDELALEIAIEAVRDQLRDTGESLDGPAIIRKAAEAVTVSAYFVEEARERLRWLNS